MLAELSTEYNCSPKHQCHSDDERREANMTPGIGIESNGDTAPVAIGCRNQRDAMRKPEEIQHNRMRSDELGFLTPAFFTRWNILRGGRGQQRTTAQIKYTARAGCSRKPGTPRIPQPSRGRPIYAMANAPYAVMLNFGWRYIDRSLP